MMGRLAPWRLPLGAKLELRSQPGAGTRVALRLPLLIRDGSSGTAPAGAMP